MRGRQGAFGSGAGSCFHWLHSEKRNVFCESASSELPFQNPQLSGMVGVCLIFPHDFVTSLCMCICLLETFFFNTSGLLFVNKFLPSSSVLIHFLCFELLSGAS